MSDWLGSIPAVVGVLIGSATTLSADAVRNRRDSKAIEKRELAARCANVNTVAADCSRRCLAYRFGLMTSIDIDHRHQQSEELFASISRIKEAVGAFRLLEGPDFAYAAQQVQVSAETFVNLTLDVATFKSDRNTYDDRFTNVGIALDSSISQFITKAQLHIREGVDSAHSGKSEPLSRFRRITKRVRIRRFRKANVSNNHNMS